MKKSIFLNLNEKKKRRRKTRGGKHANRLKNKVVVRYKENFVPSYCVYVQRSAGISMEIKANLFPNRNGNYHE